MVHACPPRPDTGTGSGSATWYSFLQRSHWVLRQEFLRNGRGKPGLGQGFKVNWWKLHGFEISKGGTLRVTAAVHRFINYVKQYEKCDLAAGETTLKVEPWTCERLLYSSPSAGFCRIALLSLEVVRQRWMDMKINLTFSMSWLNFCKRIRGLT